MPDHRRFFLSVAECESFKADRFNPRDLNVF